MIIEPQRVGQEEQSASDLTDTFLRAAVHHGALAATRAFALAATRSPEAARDAVELITSIADDLQDAIPILRMLADAMTDDPSNFAMAFPRVDASAPPIDDDMPDEPSEAVEAPDSMMTLLDTLPSDYRQVTFVGDALAAELKLTVVSVPRRGSRGNAVLYVLSRYGRNRPISLDELEHAMRTMGVAEVEGQSFRRLVGWEVRQLIRRHWPIVRSAAGWRLDVPPEGSMT